MQSGASSQASGGEGRQTDGLSRSSLQTLSRITFNAPRAFDTSVEEDHNEDKGDDDDGGDESSYDTSFHQPRYCWFSPHTEPQNKAVELLLSGDFGRVGLKINAERKNLNITRSLLSRPHCPMPALYQEQYFNVNLLSSASFTNHLLLGHVEKLVPNTNGTSVATYESNVYTAQFSAGEDYKYISLFPFTITIRFVILLHLCAG